MRITTKMFYDRFLSDYQKNMEAIFKSQEQISTGKRVNRPSDDPAALSRIVSYRTQISSISEYKKAIDTGRGYLGSIDSGLSSLNEELIRARELALEAADASSTGTEGLLSPKRWIPS